MSARRRVRAAWVGWSSLDPEARGGALILSVVLLGMGGIAVRRPGGLTNVGAAVEPLCWAGAAVLAAVLVRWLSGRQGVRGAVARVHAHGDGGQREIGRHELGHVAAAEATGMGVRRVRIGDGWGYVESRREVSPQATVTFLAAGHLAVGTRRGADADLRQIRAVLRTVPRADRARVSRDGIADARRIVRRQAGRIRRDGDRLAERGRM